MNLCLFFFLFLFNSCREYEPERVKPLGEHKVKVEFEVFSDNKDLKSSVQTQENYINNTVICAYDRDGMLVGEVEFSGKYTGYMTLFTGRTYSVYALSNVKDFSAPKYEGEIFEMRYAISDISEFERHGFPMASRVRVTISENDMKVRLNMVRMVSRITFSAESSSLPGFRVTSVRLMNAPMDVTCFQPSSATTRTAEGDSATDRDLDIINSGGSADFYMFENCQGVLLPDNTDPREKVPDNLPAAKSELCTYFEVTAVLDGTSGLTGPVTYRFYLGQDLVSDFSVFRNHHNKVTLVVTSGGLDEVSWRIDSDELIPVPVPIVAVGSKGMICYTDANGAVKRQTVGSDCWNDVIFAGGKYVAVGNNGSIGVSNDGVMWDLQIVGTANWRSVAYGNGCFVVAGYYERPVPGSSYSNRTFAYVARSLNADQWTLTEDPDYIWSDIVYGNGSFLVTGRYGMWDSSLTYWITMKSSDGISWVKSNNGSRDYPALLAGDGEFIGLDSGSYIYSEDGNNWSGNIYGGFSNMDDFVWDKKRKYVATGRFGNVAYSSDCRNWSASQVPVDGSWNGLTYGKERFVAVGENGATIYSADGKTWYKINLGITNTLYSVCVMN